MSVGERTDGQGPPRPWAILSAEEALLVLPLVQAVDGPVLDLLAWRRLVRAWLRGTRAPRGIVGLRNAIDTIFAAFLFLVHDRGPSGASLCVPRAWLIEMGPPGRAARATFEAVEQLARQYGCAAMAIELALVEGPGRDIARALHGVDRPRDDAGRDCPGAGACVLSFAARPDRPRLRRPVTDRPGSEAARCRDARRH